MMSNSNSPPSPTPPPLDVEQQFPTRAPWEFQTAISHLIMSVPDHSVISPCLKVRREKGGGFFC